MRALQFAIATANLACKPKCPPLSTSLVTVTVERPTLQHLPVCIASMRPHPPLLGSLLQCEFQSLELLPHPPLTVKIYWEQWEGPPGWAEHPLRTGGLCTGSEIKLNSGRKSDINGEKFAKRLRRQRHIGPSCDSPELLALHYAAIYAARLLARSGAPAAAAASARSESQRCCSGAASGAAKGAAVEGRTGASQRGLRPHCGTCCRIRLHWPATAPLPRAIPPNGRGLRMRLSNDFKGPQMIL